METIKLKNREMTGEAVEALRRLNTDADPRTAPKVCYWAGKLAKAFDASLADYRDAVNKVMAPARTEIDSLPALAEGADESAQRLRMDEINQIWTRHEQDHQKELSELAEIEVDLGINKLTAQAIIEAKSWRGKDWSAAEWLYEGEPG